MRSRAQDTHSVFALYIPLLTLDVKNELFFFFFLIRKSFKVPQNDLLTVDIVQKDIPFLAYQHPSPQKEGPDKNYNLAYYYILKFQTENLCGY